MISTLPSISCFNITFSLMANNSKRHHAIIFLILLFTIGLFGFLLSRTFPSLMVSSASDASAESYSTKSCSTPTTTERGKSTDTTDRSGEKFMMFSSYNLEPYSDKYIKNIISNLSRNNITGILYSSVGEISSKLGSDENLLNRKIFSKAQNAGADMWLQIRVYANNINVDGEMKTATAQEILEDKEVRHAFRDRIKKEVYAYQKYFPDTCKIIAFEEAGIYHKSQGGGHFWSSPQGIPHDLGVRPPNDQYDTVFATRLSKIFDLIHTYAKSVNPNCEVGMHLGHSVFINSTPLKERMSWLASQGSYPDFMFYDLYEKASSSYTAYEKKLTQRREIMKSFGIPAYHLAQLHTMNDFQNGKGRTPSKADIDNYVALSEQLNFNGIGFYTKNALPSENSDGFVVNKRGQRPVYESSKDRWDYGILKLRERDNINTNNYFDLVLHGNFGDGLYDVYLKNTTSNKNDFIVRIDPENKRGIVGGHRNALIVERLLSRNLYMNSGKVELSIVPITSGSSKVLTSASIIPSQPSQKYYSSHAISQDLRSNHFLDRTESHFDKAIKLESKKINIALCKE